MKKYFAIFASLILGFTACDIKTDILNTSPESQLNPDSYFKTETDLQLFSNAFYAQFDDFSNFYELQSDHYINLNLSDVLRGGNVRTVPATGGGWNFNMLRRINNLLALNQCEDAAIKNQYDALARFFRAYFFFEKVKRFGDVPWIDKAYGSSDKELYNPRDPREFVIHKILEDLNAAIEGLPEAKSLYRVNKYAALAFKAQVCLYEGTYRKYHAANTASGKPWSTEYETSEALLSLAAEAADDIMKNGGYNLKNNYVQLFAEPNADPDEMILAMKFEQSLQRRNNTSAFAIMPTQGCPGLTKKFVDSFLMADGTRFTDKEGWETMSFIDECADRDPRLSYCTRTPGYTRIGAPDNVLAPDFACSVTGFQIAKFVMDCTLPDVDRVTMSYNDLPIFRLGEVYLIYAEALAELGTLTQEDLNRSVNMLRDRVKMPHMDMAAANASPDPYLISAEYGYSSPVLKANPNLGVILEIRRERAVELAQEGRRWDDLMRWKEGKCIDQAMYGPYFPGPGKYDLTGDGKADIYLYEGDEKPADKDIQVLKIGEKTGVILSDGNKGYVDNQKGIAHSFNENRDYLYPIPTDERNLNNNLTQNPGWNDGLSF